MFLQAIFASVSIVVVYVLGFQYFRVFSPPAFFPTTDIIGFPVFANFNIDHFFLQHYHFNLFLFPILSFVLFWLLCRLARRPDSIFRFPDPARDHVGVLSILKRTGTVARGLILGFLLAYVCTQSVMISWGVGAGLAIVVAAASYFRPRVALGILLALLPWSWTVLGWASSLTQRINPEGQVEAISWFPSWAVVASIGITYAWIAFEAYRRRGDTDSLQSLETWGFMMLPVGILFFLFGIYVNAGSYGADFFHEGESLGAAYWMLKGLVPWRDLIFIHGYLEDPFRSLFGMALFEPTRWGAIAGQTLVLGPFARLSFYFMSLFFFRSTPFFGMVVGLAAPYLLPMLYGHFHFRFLMLSFCMGAFAWVIARPAAWRRSVLLAALLSVQFLLTPESAYWVAASALTLILFESGWPVRLFPVNGIRGFQKTFQVGIACATIMATWLIYLASQGALEGYLHYFANFGSGHRYTGGVTLLSSGPWYERARTLLILSNLLFIWFLIQKTRTRKPLSELDWMMVLLSVFHVFYHQKFVSRADDHIFHVVGVVTPLFSYWAYQLVRRIPFHGGLLSVFFVFALFFQPTSLWSKFQSGLVTLPSRVSFQEKERTDSVRLGSATLNPEQMQMVRDMRRLVEAYLGPEDPFFDMTDQPMLFHFVLGLRPATRYFHVSMAMKRATQQELIQQIEQSRPKLVALNAHGGGLGAWDGVSPYIRHRWVAAHLLENYNPLILLNGTLILCRKGRDCPSPRALGLKFEGTVVDTDLYRNTWFCDWGYAPQVFSGQPDRVLGPIQGDDGVVLSLQDGVSKLDESPTRFRYLEIQLEDPGLGEIVFGSDKEMQSVISLRTRPQEGLVTLRVGLANCAQWYGWNGRQIHWELRGKVGQIRSIRLIP